MVHTVRVVCIIHFYSYMSQSQPFLNDVIWWCHWENGCHRDFFLYLMWVCGPDSRRISILLDTEDVSSLKKTDSLILCQSGKGNWRLWLSLGLSQWAPVQYRSDEKKFWVYGKPVGWPTVGTILLVWDLTTWRMALQWPFKGSLKGQKQYEGSGGAILP